MSSGSVAHAAFEHAPYGMFVARIGGEIVVMNKAMRGLLRDPSDESTRDQSLATLLANAEDVLDVLQLLYDAGHFEDLELAFRCADGSERPLRISARALPCDSPESKYVLGTVRMSAGSAAGEDAIRASRMDAVERLAAAVAHNLNNVLSAVAGYCHLLREHVRTNTQAMEDLKAIEQSGDRAAAVVRQLLVFGRRRILEPTIVDIANQLGVLEPILRRVLPADTALIIGTVDRRAHILIDSIAFNDILILLLSARTAAADAATLRINATVEPGNRVVLEVIDLGVDVDGAGVGQCFDEPLATPDCSGGYSALGLAAVHVLVARSGGRITVDQARGIETTFRLEFPAVGPDADRPVDTAARGTAEPVRCGTIMLVEDDPNLRDIARRVLDDEGYDVVEARSGEEALALASEGDRSFEVLVTDMMLPGMKGWEVGRAIKSTHPQCRMIYMSGYVDDARLRRELPEDAFFIGKPFTPLRLLEAVEAALTRPGLSRGT